MKWLQLSNSWTSITSCSLWGKHFRSAFLASLKCYEQSLPCYELDLQKSLILQQRVCTLWLKQIPFPNLLSLGTCPLCSINPRGHYVKWNKPDTKANTGSSHVYIESRQFALFWQTLKSIAYHEIKEENYLSMCFLG